MNFRAKNQLIIVIMKHWILLEIWIFAVKTVKNSTIFNIWWFCNFIKVLFLARKFKLSRHIWHLKIIAFLLKNSYSQFWTFVKNLILGHNLRFSNSVVPVCMMIINNVNKIYHCIFCFRPQLNVIPKSLGNPLYKPQWRQHVLK